MTTDYPRLLARARTLAQAAMVEAGGHPAVVVAGRSAAKRPTAFNPGRPLSARVERPRLSRLAAPPAGSGLQPGELAKLPWAKPALLAAMSRALARLSSPVESSRLR